MPALTTTDYETLSKFIELSLNLIMRGFDEMQMPHRIELMNTFGKVLTLGFDQTYGRLQQLEKRVEQLEKKQKKKH